MEHVACQANASGSSQHWRETPKNVVAGFLALHLNSKQIEHLIVQNRQQK